MASQGQHVSDEGLLPPPPNAPATPPPATAQALEDLACAYWRSDVLFAALELRLFAALADRPLTLAELARAAACREAPLVRLLTALAQLGLLATDDGRFSNLPIAHRHLVPGGEDYLGDFLLYRRYLQPPWQGLASAVAARPLPPALSPQDDYHTRNLHYVRALHQLARLKAREIAGLLATIAWRGPILDLGGGAGAVSRELLRQRPGSQATLFELPEVLTAAHSLLPQQADWLGIEDLAGDFRHDPVPGGNRFGLILLANVLHTYDEAAARHCLARAVAWLAPGGHLLIHDYCPDRTPIKGQLYDLNMLLNTHQGQCFAAQDVSNWLSELGLLTPQVVDLPSDSSLILAQAAPC